MPELEALRAWNGRCSSQRLALNANGARIEGDVRLHNGFKATDGVSLDGASIAGNLDCTSGSFAGDAAMEKPALLAAGSKIGMNVKLSEGFKAAGSVNLHGAMIGRDLECDGGVFEGSRGAYSLIASNAKIEGDVSLGTNFSSKGGVDLVSAIVGGDLDCDAGSVTGADGKPALDANGARFGSVCLRDGFKSLGEVNFVGATIAGSLECDDGEFLASTVAWHWTLTEWRLAIVSF